MYEKSPFYLFRGRRGSVLLFGTYHSRRLYTSILFNWFTSLRSGRAVKARLLFAATVLAVAAAVCLVTALIGWFTESPLNFLILILAILPLFRGLKTFN